eukprot:5237364-Prymnesium_polylepis.1
MGWCMLRASTVGEHVRCPRHRARPPSRPGCAAFCCAYPPPPPRCAITNGGVVLFDGNGAWRRMTREIIRPPITSHT